MQTQIDPVTVLFIILAIAIVILAWAWHFSRSRSILQKWADGNGYTLMQAELRLFRTGPFFLNTTRSQVVYYVTILDALGRERKGWVKVGSWLIGLWSNQAEVKWDT
jgi:hypothetical protein